MHRNYKCEIFHYVLISQLIVSLGDRLLKTHRNLSQSDIIDFSLSFHIYSDVKQANKREGEFYNSGYVDYTISTICNHPAFPAGYFTVERRFSDFVW